MRTARRRAVLVGVDSFKVDAWEPLPYVRNDIEGADGLRRVLSSDLGSCCFSPHHVEVLIGPDATSTRVEQVLNRLCVEDAIESHDLVVFYFSGHGTLEKKTELPVLVTYETDPQAPHKSGLAFPWLEAFARKSKARLILVVDACFSGHLLPGGKSGEEHADAAAKQFAQLPDVAVFASCEAEQVSRAAPGQIQSLFTSALVAGLRGDGSALEEGQVTTHSLRRYLEERFQNEPQKPAILVPEDPLLLSVPQRPLVAGAQGPSTPSDPWHEYLAAHKTRYEQGDIYTSHAFRRMECDETLFAVNERGDGRIRSGPRKLSAPAVILDKLAEGSISTIAILGDVGSGKTTLLMNLWYELAKKYMADPKCRPAPLYIPLARFRDIRFDEVLGEEAADARSLETAADKFRAVLMNLLQYEYGIPVFWPDLEAACKSRSIVLIFDGLDEAGIDARPGMIRNVLHLLNHFATRGAPVVFSCRTHFLRDDEELVDTLDSTVPPGTDYAILKLRQFTRNDVIAYIDSMAEDENLARRCRDFLDLTFRGIDQLARRPFLLEMLVKSAREILAEEGDQPIPEYLVFERFLRGWLNRDRWRFARFLYEYQDAIERDLEQSFATPPADYGPESVTRTWAERTIVYFIELLANDLRISGRRQISYREIPARIRDHFPNMPEVFLNFFEYTLRTCSFLVRDTSGNYEFLHDSVLAYFSARAVISEIRRDHYPWDEENIVTAVPHSLGRRPLPESVRELLSDMLEVRDWGRIEDWLRYDKVDQSPHTLCYLPGNCLRLLADQRKNDLSGYDLRNLHIKSIDLRGVDLSRSDLCGAVIEDVNLSDANLEGALLEGAKMVRVQLGGTRLKSVELGDGSTVISHAIRLESAREPPERFLEIVVQSEKGQRTYEPVQADDCAMVLIEGARFWMGTNSILAEPEERPAHEVEVVAFHLDVHPVTNKQFAKFVQANPEWGKEAGIARTKNVYYLSLWQGNNPPSRLLDHPIVYVNWYAAIAYAEWTGKRLPTEAEWELALRDRNHARRWDFPWGPRERGMPDALKERTEKRSTYPVGEIRASSYGLVDMTGNVNEWVQDWFDPGYWRDRASKVQRDPRGPDFGRMKILRGGSFLSHDTRPFHTSYRRFLLPHNTNVDGGFRCARDAQ